MKIKKQQRDRKQSLSCIYPVKQHHVSPAQCEQHWPLQGTKSREPAVTARDSYSLELDPATWVLPCQGPTGGDKHLPWSTWGQSFQCSPEHCKESTLSAVSCHQSQYSAGRGWDRPVFPEKQPRSRWAQDMAISKWFTIWIHSLWSQTTRSSWCLAQEGTENIKNYHLTQLQSSHSFVCWAKVGTQLLRTQIQSATCPSPIFPWNPALRMVGLCQQKQILFAPYSEDSPHSLAKCSHSLLPPVPQAPANCHPLGAKHLRHENPNTWQPTSLSASVKATAAFQADFPD